VLSSGWIVWPFGVASLLVVSLVMFGALTTPGPPRPERGGAFGLSTSTPTISPTGVPSATATPSAIATTSSPTPSAPGRHVAPPKGGPGSSLALPTPGAYTVRVEGSEGVHFTAFGFCNRDFPASATLFVKDSYEGRESPTSFQFDISYSTRHFERHHYRYTSAGVFLDYEFAEVSCAGAAQSTNLPYSPPQEKVRLPLRVGATWSGEGGDAERTERYSARVLRKETLTVDGRNLDVYVIETTIEMSGDEHGSRLQRWWYAPAVAMPVRWFEEFNAARGPATYEASLTVTLVDLDPQ
jgi:hypothetical protein